MNGRVTLTLPQGSRRGLRNTLKRNRFNLPLMKCQSVSLSDARNRYAEVYATRNAVDRYAGFRLLEKRDLDRFSLPRGRRELLSFSEYKERRISNSKRQRFCITFCITPEKGIKKGLRSRP